MDIEYVIMVIVAVCLLLAGYEMRDEFKHKAAHALAHLGIGYVEQRGDEEHYCLTLPSRRTLALFLLLALAAWVVIARMW